MSGHDEAGSGQSGTDPASAVIRQRENFLRAVMRIADVDYHEAEDIASEVGLRALAAGVILPSDEEGFRYLRTAARNEAIDRRREADRTAQPEALLAFRVTTEAAEASRDVAELLAERETWEDAMRDLAALPPRYREVLEMRYLDDLPPREIAARLGLEVRVVESRLYQAKKRMTEGASERRIAELVVALLLLRGRKPPQPDASSAAFQAPTFAMTGVAASLVFGMLVAPTPASEGSRRPAHAWVSAAPHYGPPAPSTRRGVMANDRSEAGPVIARGAASSVAPGVAAVGRALPPLTLGPCGAVCVTAPTGEDRRMAGDVIRVRALGTSSPGAAQSVTPVCWLVPDNPAVTCRREKEPDEWVVKETPPVAVSGGSES